MSLDDSKTPISPPPPGIVPNFDDPVSFSTAIIILAIVFLTLSCVFFGGRIYSKIYIAHSPGYDDCMLLRNTRGPYVLMKNRGLLGCMG